MGRQRDTNRTRIEQAERDMLTSGFISTVTLKEVQAFANNVVKRAWFAKQFGKPTINVVADYDRGNYTNGCEPKSWSNTSIEIRVHPGEITRLAVLHSMAHLIVPHKHGEVPHTTEWVKAYLELVRRYHNGKIDEDFKRSFKQALMAHGVKTKVISEATREKQRDAWVRRMTPSEDDLLATLRGLEEL